MLDNSCAEHHHHEHHHSHTHGHHHHAHVPTSMGGIFIFSIVLNALYVIVEAAVGFYQGSLSLLSDAGHNLSDVFSLALVLIAFRLAKVHPTKHFTYGLKKSTVLISLLNAVILLIAVGAIVVEAVHKFRVPTMVDGAAVSWTAAVGIIINGLTVVLLMHGQKSDINVRGAFLHMLADTLVSVGVVVSGIAILYTGLSIIDPIVSLIIAAVILVSTWRLLSESLTLALDGTPEGINVDSVEAVIRGCENVKDVHHVHVWAMSTTANALTAHVIMDDITAMDVTIHSIKAALANAGIGHATIEAESHFCGCTECE